MRGTLCGASHGVLLLACLLACGSAASALAAKPWPQLGGSAQHTGVSPYSFGKGTKATTYWSQSFTGGIGGSMVMDSRGMLYVGGGGTQFANPQAGAIHMSNGTFAWARDLGYAGLGGAGTLTPALSPDEAVLYVHATSGVLFALDTATGDQLWNVTTASSPREGFFCAPTVAADGTIFVAGAPSGFNMVHAVSPAGKTLWLSETLGGQPATVGVCEDNGIVVLGTDSGGYGDTADLYGLDKATGKTVWHATSNTTTGFSVFVDAAPVILDQVAYITVADQGHVVALNTKDGSPFVKTGMQGGGGTQYGAAATPDGNQLFWGCNYGGGGDEQMIYSLCGAFTKNGSVSFQLDPELTLHDGATAAPTMAADGRFLFATGDTSGWGTLYAFDSADPSGSKMAKPLWTYSKELAMGSAPVIGPDGTIYVNNRYLGQIWAVQVTE